MSITIELTIETEISEIVFSFHWNKVHARERNGA